MLAMKTVGPLSKRSGRHLLVWLLLVSAQPAVGDMLNGRVIGVADGVTITLLDSNRQQHRIRLAGIGDPGKGQPYGARSRLNLSNRAFGKDAKADCYKVDRYGREVCIVYVHGRDVGLAQLQAGLAWWYWKYAHEQLVSAYQSAEGRAAADRMGLWKDKNPVPPREWRGAH